MRAVRGSRGQGRRRCSRSGEAPGGVDQAPAASAIDRVLARPDQVPVGSGRRGEKRVRHARDGQIGAEVDEQQPFVGGSSAKKRRSSASGPRTDPSTRIAFARRSGEGDGLATEPQEIAVERENIATLVHLGPVQAAALEGC